VARVCTVRCPQAHRREGSSEGHGRECWLLLAGSVPDWAGERGLAQAGRFVRQPPFFRNNVVTASSAPEQIDGYATGHLSVTSTNILMQVTASIPVLSRLQAFIGGEAHTAEASNQVTR